ncbi:MAG TPA: SDR family oxidoreductase, partial [Acidimicrobiales bacterium]|nr:SDR family oxidoreductase [Acidimicrobiales bacterium]
MASVVLVTGASSGIGLATAVAFARDGDRVFATVRDGRGREALQQAGAPIEAVTMDVRDDASVRSAVDGTVAAAGRIDVLVNNAGISHIGAVETTPDDVWRQLFEVNVLGPVRVLRAVLPSMRAAGSGTIVNVSSMNGRVPATFGGAYSATKFALEGLSESLLFEVEPFRVRVVIVEPGQFDTPIFSKMQSALAASADPTSPYAEREAKMLGASLPAGNGPADPADAAAVIVAAARGDRPGFRHVAGADAEAILAARVGAGSDEAWFDLVRAFLSQRADPDSADDGDARKVDARSVHHSQSFGGMWFTRGVFDPIRGSIVAKELERLTIAMFEADWAVAKQRLGREPTILELKRTPAQ